jgi:apolipoprotein N-acyltransferase
MVSRETIPRSRELLLLIASGVCLVLAFPPIGLVPVAFVALVPLFYVLRKSRRDGFWNGFRPGFVAGVSFFLPLLYWLVFLASDQMNNPVVMSGPLILLVILQSLYWGFFTASACLVDGRTLLPRAVAIPALWVAFEQLRSLGVIGFTWGAVGYAAVPVPSAIQFASVTGLLGVSFWVVLVNVLVLELLTGKSRARAKYAVVLLVVLIVPFAHGALAMREEPTGPTMRVAVLQPNIPGETKWDPAYKSLSFDVLEKLSRMAATEGPDLIVWPETAAPSYLLMEPDDLARVSGLARELAVPILTGCPDLVPLDAGTCAGRPLNSALFIDSEGDTAGSYSKIRLVPFGEVIPFETVLPFLEGVDFGEADFAPGTERKVFGTPKGGFSVLICYESTFPRLARQFVPAGAGLLVNITNDVWYGRTSMPFQHASMAVMRCVETRRSLARSANSGVSMMVDPFGRVLAETEIFDQVYLVAELPVGSALTFYARHGDVFPWAVTVLGGLMVAVGVWQGYTGSVRRKRRGR